MPHHAAPIRTADPDALFTMTISLMWRLHDQAAIHGVPWAGEALVVAIGELELGPWQHLGPAPELQGLPFTVACAVLDRMLVELGRVTPGFGARVAVAKAQSWLDPNDS